MSDEVLKRLQDLEERVSELEQRLQTSVIDILRQRGFVVDSFNPVAQVLLPHPRSGDRVERYCHLLHRYSFRILLRDVIRFRAGFRIEDLLHYCSQRKARRFVKDLVSLGIVEESGPGRYRLRNQQATSFGDTLEWYVAQTFEREFASPAVWGVKLRALESGGDYDVVARLGQHLVYVETKSAPPRNIEQPAITGFLKRLDDLQPDLAIFLEDTHLKMEIKINLMFESERESQPGAGWLSPETKMLRRGVFQAGRRVFIINSKPSIIHNLRVCLRAFWTQRPSP